LGNRLGAIVFEDLDIQNMLKNNNLVKSISDVAWGMQVQATESKAEYAGSLRQGMQSVRKSDRCPVLWGGENPSPRNSFSVNNQ